MECTVMIWRSWGRTPIESWVELGVRSTSVTKSLMAEWLEQVSQWHGMYCHDLEVMSSNPDQVKLGVRSTSVLSYLNQTYHKPWFVWGLRCSLLAGCNAKYEPGVGPWNEILLIQLINEIEWQPKTKPMKDHYVYSCNNSWVFVCIFTCS